MFGKKGHLMWMTFEVIHIECARKKKLKSRSHGIFVRYIRTYVLNYITINNILMIRICNVWIFKLLIKNVSSSTSHKKNPFLRLFLTEFKKNLPSTFIYKSILIKKNCMNANIMNTQIFHLSMTSTVIEGLKMSLLF